MSKQITKTKVALLSRLHELEEEKRSLFNEIKAVRADLKKHNKELMSEKQRANLKKAKEALAKKNTSGSKK